MRIGVVLLTVAALACSGAGDSKDTAAQRGDGSSVPAKGVAAAQGSDTGGRGTVSIATGSPDVPRAGTRPRVLIIGTSITAGLGLDPSDAYPAVIQHIADSVGRKVEIVNAGLSGETSAGALRRADWLLSDSSAVIMLETGANDGLRGLDPDSTAANIRAIIAKIRQRYPSVPVVLAQMEAPPNMGHDYTQRFHGIFPRVAKQTGVSLMPFLLDSVAGIGKLNQPDGIHPTKEGARIVARNVWRALEPQIARLDR